MKLHATALLAAVLLAGCASEPPQPHADAVTEAACRQRADAIYKLRHPDATYREDTYTSSLRDAPFGTSGSPSLPTHGLGGEYERDQLLRDCLTGSSGAGPTPAAPPAAAPPAASAPLAAPPAQP